MSVDSEVEKAISILRFYQITKDDIDRIIGLVQENQGFFGVPPAGQSCIKLAADRLEKEIEEWRSNQPAS